ncbi:MAG: GGDEF domain-containing protein, partial [Clostridiales bacterium]|nr:GGDEF domain-containing protein [Clostridiales bacterium]
MFALGFFLRFRISVTLVLEALYVVAVVLFLFIEKSYIPNFYPSLINVVCSFVLASCAAFMYWNSRKNNFLSTKKLETLASSDYLTRLHNRRSFDAYIECEWQHVRNENLCISLFFIDVDHFKKYNDFYGHPEGDKCLCAIADIIATSVRKSDFAARYGGEEFVVSLTGANEEIAKRVANDILNAMRDHKIPHEASVVPYVTLSIGCMICHPGKRGDIGMEDFMQMADDALYMAKEQGRDRIVFHPESAIH